MRDFAVRLAPVFRLGVAAEGGGCFDFGCADLRAGHDLFEGWNTRAGNRSGGVFNFCEIQMLENLFGNRHIRGRRGVFAGGIGQDFLRRLRRQQTGNLERGTLAFCGESPRGRYGELRSNSVGVSPAGRHRMQDARQRAFDIALRVRNFNRAPVGRIHRVRPHGDFPKKLPAQICRIHCLLRNAGFLKPRKHIRFRRPLLPAKIRTFHNAQHRHAMAQPHRVLRARRVSLLGKLFDKAGGAFGGIGGCSFGGAISCGEKFSRLSKISKDWRNRVRGILRALRKRARKNGSILRRLQLKRRLENFEKTRPE